MKLQWSRLEASMKYQCRPLYRLYLEHLLVSIAAIPAQIIESLASSSACPRMEKMTHPQMVLSLRAYGEEAPKGWTKVQLLARLKELEAQGEIVAPTTKKIKTPLEEAVSALNRAGARKALLQKYVEEECGIRITGNETMHTLQQKAMVHLLASVETSPKDVLGFGKYATQTYEAVKRNDPRYCEWAMVTAKEGQCSDYLKRFATWLEETKRTPPKAIAKAKVDLGAIINKNKEKSKDLGYHTTGTDDPTTGTGPTSPATTTEPPTMPSVAATSSNDPGNVVQQLVQAVTTLAQEVQALKDEKDNRPRKTVAKPDEEMIKDQDGS